MQEPCEWYVSCTWCNCFVMMFCCCSLDDVALLGTKPLDTPDAEPAPSVEPTTSLLVEATSPSVSVEATPSCLPPVQSTRPGFPTEPTGSRFEPLPMNYVIPLDFVSPPLRSALREGRKLIFRERTQLISAIYQHITTSYHTYFLCYADFGYSLRREKSTKRYEYWWNRSLWSEIVAVCPINKFKSKQITFRLRGESIRMHNPPDPPQYQALLITNRTAIKF